MVLLIKITSYPSLGEEEYSPNNVPQVRFSEEKLGPNPKGEAGLRVLPMVKSTAPNPKEGTGPLRRANGEERGPKPKGEAGLHKR